MEQERYAPIIDDEGRLVGSICVDDIENLIGTGSGYQRLHPELLEQSVLEATNKEFLPSITQDVMFCDALGRMIQLNVPQLYVGLTLVLELCEINGGCTQNHNRW